MRVKVAVGYARSSGRINPKSSIPNQIYAIQKYCERNNILLKKMYVDECKTGTKVEGRTEYQLLKTELTVNNDVDMILFAYSDRLGREAYEFILGFEELKEQNIELVFISEGLSSKSITPIQLVMLAVQAEMDNKMRYQRITDSKEDKMKSGAYLLSRAPYGYKLDKDRKLILEDNQAEIVKKVFNLYNIGFRVCDILRTINEIYDNHGLDPKKIAGLLKNKTYTGYIYQKDKNTGYKQLSFVNHPEIISLEVFEECQEKVISRAEKKGERKKPFRLLCNGIFCCPICRKNLRIDNSNYTCCEKHWKFKAEELDMKVLSFLENQDKECMENKKIKEKYMQQIKKKKQAQIMFASGDISYEQFCMKIDKIENEMDMLKSSTLNVRNGVYSSYIERGDLELLKRSLIAEKAKFTLGENGEVLPLLL